MQRGRAAFFCPKTGGAHRVLPVRDSTLHKLRQTVKTLEAKENPARYKSQLTLARRRIEAFTLANELIQRELEALPTE